jgi:predicted SprT family Zn-dependent metalloprotease
MNRKKYICSACGKAKLLSGFYTKTEKGKQYKSKYCRKCNDNSRWSDILQMWMPEGYWKR